MAVPPDGRIASIPSRIVGLSFVGPVTAPTVLANGRDDRSGPEADR